MAIDKETAAIIAELERDLSKLSGEARIEEESSGEASGEAPDGPCPWKLGSLLKSKEGHYYIIASAGDGMRQITRITGSPGNRWKTPSTLEDLYKNHSPYFTLVDADFRSDAKGVNKKMRKLLDDSYNK